MIRRLSPLPLPLLLSLLMLCSCSESEPRSAPQLGHLVVYVYWDQDQGSPGKRVEVVETGDEGVTDSMGIVEFALAPGAYTVRAHDINGPGGLFVRTVEESVTVERDATSRVEIFDCVDCLVPTDAITATPTASASPRRAGVR